MKIDQGILRLLHTMVKDSGLLARYPLIYIYILRLIIDQGIHV